MSKLDFDAGNANPTFGNSVATFFLNSKKTVCPVTKCTLSGQGCTGVPTNTKMPDTNSPWTITGDQTNPSGWKETNCVTCENAGGSVAFDNIEFEQKPDCSTTLSKKATPTIPDLVYSAGNANPDFGQAQALFFDNTKPTLCPINHCTLEGIGCSGTTDKTNLKAAPTFIIAGD